MIPIFPAIVAVLIGVSFEEYYSETAMPEGDLLWILLALPLCAVPVLVAEALFRWARLRFEANRPVDIRPLWKLVIHLPLPLYAIALFACGWPKIVVPLGIEGAVLLDQAVVLLPYFLCLALAVVEAARMRRPLVVGPNGPRAASLEDVKGVLNDQGRQIGLAVVPLFGLILALDVAQDTDLRLYFDNLPLLATVALAALLVLLAFVYPLLFRYGMGLKPLVAGAPLRLRLEELAAHLDFRCRDILYWPTRRPVLNAAIVGVAPRFRYVILTEELCSRLTLDELCAVFAHEVGHGKRHHALFYLLFSGMFLAVLVPVSTFVGAFIEERTQSALDSSLAAALLFYLPVFAFYWVVLFSYLSRRFELEADVYGVRSTGDAEMFIATLEKVARIGRIERRSSALRHFSVAGRTGFLRRAFLEGDTALLERFLRRIRQLRRFIVVSFAVMAVFGGAWLFVDSMRGAGVILLERGRPEGARDLLSAASSLRPGDPVGAALLAEADLYLDTEAGGAAPETRWGALLEGAAEFSSAERDAVLDALLSGWARAVASGRADVGLRLIRRAEDFRRAARAAPDEELGAELEQMREVTIALQRGDDAALSAVAERPPRWLRRPVVRSALEHLLARAEARAAS